MNLIKSIRIPVVAGALILSGSLLAGCCPGTEELQQLSTLRSEVSSLEDEANTLKDERAALESEVSEMNRKIAECNKQKEETRANLDKLPQ